MLLPQNPSVCHPVRRKRALSSGVVLTAADAAIVKGMLARGDRHHDIAAYYGVNAGRVAEIATGLVFADVNAASAIELPPPGPYVPACALLAVHKSLMRARMALAEAENLLTMRR